MCYADIEVEVIIASSFKKGTLAHCGIVNCTFAVNSEEWLSKHS